MSISYKMPNSDAAGAATAKALGFVIAACMVLALLRYAVAVLLIALSGLMLRGACATAGSSSASSPYQWLWV